MGGERHPEASSAFGQVKWSPYLSKAPHWCQIAWCIWSRGQPHFCEEQSATRTPLSAWSTGVWKTTRLSILEPKQQLSTSFHTMNAPSWHWMRRSTFADFWSGLPVYSLCHHIIPDSQEMLQYWGEERLCQSVLGAAQQQVGTLHGISAESLREMPKTLSQLKTPEHNPHSVLSTSTHIPYSQPHNNNNNNNNNNNLSSCTAQNYIGFYALDNS